MCHSTSFTLPAFIWVSWFCWDGTPAMICRTSVVRSQPVLLIWICYRCIPDQKCHAQFKRGRLLRMGALPHCWWDLLTILIPRTAFLFIVTAVCSVGFVYFILVLVLVWLFAFCLQRRDRTYWYRAWLWTPVTEQAALIHSHLAEGNSRESRHVPIQRQYLPKKWGCIVISSQIRSQLNFSMLITMFLPISELSHSLKMLQCANECRKGNTHVVDHCYHTNNGYNSLCSCRCLYLTEAVKTKADHWICYNSTKVSFIVDALFIMQGLNRKVCKRPSKASFPL